MSKQKIGCVILAGGLARRMGGVSKPLQRLNGETMIAHILERIRPQVSEIVINANHDQDAYACYSLPIIPDPVEGYAGPLAGILAGMDWIAEKRPDIEYLLSVSGDSPFLPQDLVERLIKPIVESDAELTVASRNGRTQPVIGLWDWRLRDDLRRCLTEEKIFKVDRWTARFNIQTVSFDAEENDPFFNVNTIDDLKQAEKILLAHHSI